MTISLVQALSSDPDVSLRGQADRHGVHAVRALIASTVARDCHRRHFTKFGLLGAATGPVQAFGDGFRMDTQLGFIDIRSNFTPVPMITHMVTVEFMALEINETDETYDEPYVVIGVVSLAPEFNDDLDKLATTHLVRVPGEDHKRGYVFVDTQTVWKKGQLVGGTGMKLCVYAYEEDSGEPDEVAAEINAYLKEKMHQASQAVSQAFGVGAEAGAIENSPELQAVLNVISLGLADLVADDEVGYESLEIPMSEVKALAAIPEAAFPGTLLTGPKGIKYNKKLTVSGDGDGKYTIYLRVSAVEVPPIDAPPAP